MANSKDWEEWLKQYTILIAPPQRERLEIDGPPCAQCVHWDPLRIIEGGEVTIYLCDEREIFPDFSCFVRKERKKAKRRAKGKR